MNQHSVLGGTVPSGDPAMAYHRTMMVVYPTGTLKDYLEICLFVAALFTTKELVRMALTEQRPQITEVARGIVPRFREVLLFSIKYMVVMGASGAVLIFVATSSLIPERLHQYAVSKPFTAVFALTVECCLAWLLLPAAIRLLRPPSGPAISTQERKVGTVFAVATAAGSMILEYSVKQAEATITIGSVWEGWAIAVINTVIVNAPQVMLFIALALLAIELVSDKSPAAVESELS